MLDVHNRDIVDQLINKNIQTLDDFEWLAQLRYYYQEEDSLINIIVKCINARRFYGFEYLGCSTRYLVHI